MGIAELDRLMEFSLALKRSNMFTNIYCIFSAGHLT